MFFDCGSVAAITKVNFINLRTDDEKNDSG